VNSILGYMDDISKLFGPSNLQIFELLINEGASVRDLAKKAGCSPAKVTQFLGLYLRQKLVVIESEKNRKVIRLDKSSPLAREIITLLYMNKILHSRSFASLKGGASAIGLYGSVAEGNMDRHSDIDMWVVSDNKKRVIEAGRIRQQMASEFGREVSLKFYTQKDIQALKEKDPVFYNELECRSKILHGGGF